jgi:hypothetical protein
VGVFHVCINKDKQKNLRSRSYDNTFKIGTNSRSPGPLSYAPSVGESRMVSRAM